MWADSYRVAGRQSQCELADPHLLGHVRVVQVAGAPLKAVCRRKGRGKGYVAGAPLKAVQGRRKERIGEGRVMVAGAPLEVVCRRQVVSSSEG